MDICLYDYTLISGAVVGIGVAVVFVLLFDTDYLLSVLRVMADTLFRILGTVSGDDSARSVAGALGSMIIAAFPKFIIAFAEPIPILIIDIILSYVLLCSFIALGDRIWGESGLFFRRAQRKMSA